MKRIELLEALYQHVRHVRERQKIVHNKMSCSQSEAQQAIELYVEAMFALDAMIAQLDTWYDDHLADTSINAKGLKSLLVDAES